MYERAAFYKGCRQRIINFRELSIRIQTPQYRLYHFSHEAFHAGRFWGQSAARLGRLH